MTANDYKSARKLACMNQKDWLVALGISLDTHKSYCCGRRKVPPGIARTVKEIITYKNK